MLSNNSPLLNWTFIVFIILFLSGSKIQRSYDTFGHHVSSVSNFFFYHDIDIFEEIFKNFFWSLRTNEFAILY